MWIYGEFTCNRPIDNWFWWMDKQTGRWMAKAAISYITCDGIAYGSAAIPKPGRFAVPEPMRGEPAPPSPGIPGPESEMKWFVKCRFGCDFNFLQPDPGFLSSNTGLIIELRKAWDSVYLRSGYPVPEVLQFGKRPSPAIIDRFIRSATIKKTLHYTFGSIT